MERNTLLGICEQLGYRFKKQSRIWTFPGDPREKTLQTYMEVGNFKKTQQIAAELYGGSLLSGTQRESQGDPFP